MAWDGIDGKKTALLIVDLQNDFLHPDGAYVRGGQSSADIAALPERVLPVAGAMRAAGGWVVSTQFTLVPGKGGEPFISWVAYQGGSPHPKEVVTSFDQLFFLNNPATIHCQ